MTTTNQPATTWDEIMAYAEDDFDVFERLQVLEDDLLNDKTNPPLHRFTAKPEWERYWQNIADRYVSIFGDPTLKGDA